MKFPPARPRAGLASRLMRAPAGLLALALLAGSLSSSCRSINAENTREMVADISEFLGRSNPSRHVERLDRLHDWATFEHRPDLPPTVDACLEEVRTLAKSDYESWRDVALSTFFVTRVAVEDGVALNRGEAVEALGRMGKMVQEAEDPPATPLAEGAAGQAVKRLRELHAPDTGLHISPEAIEECREVVLSLGDFRPHVAPAASESEVRLSLKLLRGTLMGVVVETRCAEAHDNPAARAAVDRVVVNLASQAVRLSLAAALRFDPDATVRAAAARVLGALGPAGQSEGMGAAYAREEAPAVRREIVAALRRLSAVPGPDRGASVAVFIAALDDDDESVAFHARETLRTLAGEDLGPTATPWIVWWSRAENGGGR